MWAESPVFTFYDWFLAANFQTHSQVFSAFNANRRWCFNYLLSLAFLFLEKRFGAGSALGFVMILFISCKSYWRVESPPWEISLLSKHKTLALEKSVKAKNQAKVRRGHSKTLVHGAQCMVRGANRFNIDWKSFSIMIKPTGFASGVEASWEISFQNLVSLWLMKNF